MKPQEATHDSSGSDHDDSEPEVTVMKVHNQPSSNTNYDPNRCNNKVFALHQCTCVQ